MRMTLNLGDRVRNTIGRTGQVVSAGEQMVQVQFDGTAVNAWDDTPVRGWFSRTNDDRLTRIGPCPVCGGTGRVPVPEDSQRYIRFNARWGHWGLHGYSPAGPGPFHDGQGYEGGTLGCSNCGGQYMSCHPTGLVALRPDGTPCTHHYLDSPRSNHRRGYHVSDCEHCGDHLVIDSGD